MKKIPVKKGNVRTRKNHRIDSKHLVLLHLLPSIFLSGKSQRVRTPARPVDRKKKRDIEKVRGTKNVRKTFYCSNEIKKHVFFSPARIPQIP
jgi:hypothetical protein